MLFNVGTRPERANGTVPGLTLAKSELSLAHRAPHPARTQPPPAPCPGLTCSVPVASRWRTPRGRPGAPRTDPNHEGNDTHGDSRPWRLRVVRLRTAPQQPHRP